MVRKVDAGFPKRSCSNEKIRPIATNCAAAKCSLFDHLVCESEKILRQGDAGCLRGLEVDDELVACRLLEREIGGPRAVKDASCKFRSAGHAFLHVRPIRH